MELSAFGVDQPNLLSVDTCLVGRWDDDVGNESVDDRFVTVTAHRETSFSQQSNSVLCLRLRLDDSVKNGEIVIPHWVLDLLGITNRSHVAVVPAMMNFVNQVTVKHVILTFKAWKCYRHWDEVAAAARLCIPGTWSAGWPSGISVTTLIKFLPILLDARTLVDNSFVVLDVLDITMVYVRTINSIAQLAS